MSATESWVKEFRYAIKTDIRSGWQISNDRGNMRLLHGNKKEGFTSINLPFAWDKNQWPDAFDFIRIGADAYLESNQKLPLKIAFKLTKQNDNEITLDWEGALIRYRKTTTRTIKEPTWKKKHLPVLEAVMFYMNKAKHKPQNSKTLHKKVLNEYVHGKDKQLEGWELGTTQRRHMRLAFNKFLDYCCINEEFPSHWRPLDPKVAGERDDLIGNEYREIPTMLNYKTHVVKDSMFNTPPVLSVFVVNETLKWIEDLGGVVEVERRNIKKAEKLYAAVSYTHLTLPTKRIV